MTLIITAIAALVCTVLYFRNPKEAREWHVGTLALMYFGAALLWCVDGFASLAKGEGFIELSDPKVMMDDMLLGICVVILGVAIWGIINYVARKRGTAAVA